MKNFPNKYKLLLIGGGIIIFLLFLVWLSNSITEKSLENTVRDNQNASRTAVNEAVKSNASAANLSIERRAEDAVREKVVTPKLEAARRTSQNSKQNLEKTRKKYSDEKITHENVSSSRADNCARLRELYPGKRFEYCGD